MIRVIENKWAGYGDKHYIEAAGLSTDTKPTTNLVTGMLSYRLAPFGCI